MTSPSRATQRRQSFAKRYVSIVHSVNPQNQYSLQPTRPNPPNCGYLLHPSSVLCRKRAQRVDQAIVGGRPLRSFVLSTRCFRFRNLCLVYYLCGLMYYRSGALTSADDEAGLKIARIFYVWCLVSELTAKRPDLAMPSVAGDGTSDPALITYLSQNLLVTISPHNIPTSTLTVCSCPPNDRVGIYTTGQSQQHFYPGLALSCLGRCLYWIVGMLCGSLSGFLPCILPEYM